MRQWQPPFTDSLVTYDADFWLKPETYRIEHCKHPTPETLKYCQRSSFVPGTHLVMLFKQGKEACVAMNTKFKGAVHETTGWVALDGLKELPESASMNAWQGDWETASGTLNIIISGDALEVKGEGAWQGPVATAVHTGDFRATAKTDSNTLKLTDGDCTVNITKVGEHLIAHDNNQCGGMNVTFTGLYRKFPHNG